MLTPLLVGLLWAHVPVIEGRLHLGDGPELHVVEEQVLVHVVRQDPDLGMAQQDVGQFPQLGLGIGRARRVGR